MQLKKKHTHTIVRLENLYLQVIKVREQIFLSYNCCLTKQAMRNAKFTRSCLKYTFTGHHNLLFLLTSLLVKCIQHELTPHNHHQISERTIRSFSDAPDRCYLLHIWNFRDTDSTLLQPTEGALKNFFFSILLPSQCSY